MFTCVKISCETEAYLSKEQWKGSQKLLCISCHEISDSLRFLRRSLWNAGSSNNWFLGINYRLSWERNNSIMLFFSKHTKPLPSNPFFDFFFFSSIVILIIQHPSVVLINEIPINSIMQIRYTHLY